MPRLSFFLCRALILFIFAVPLLLLSLLMPCLSFFLCRAFLFFFAAPFLFSLPRHNSFYLRRAFASFVITYAVPFFFSFAAPFFFSLPRLSFFLCRALILFSLL
jgi:hypothetical protein